MKAAAVAVILVLSASVHTLCAASASEEQRRSAFRNREDDKTLARVVLRNGLVVVVEEHVSAPVGALVARIGFGSDDSPQSPLAAELLARRLARRLEPRLRQAGAVLEVAVAPHHTEFTAVAAESNLFRAVEAQAALLEAPEDDGQLALDLKVLQTRSAAVSPLQQQLHRLAELVYPTPPASDSSDGDPPQPAAPDYSVEDLDRLQRLHYRPANMVLAVSGSVRRERVLREVVRSMAAVEAGRGPEAATGGDLDPRVSFQYASEQAPVTQDYVFLAYPAPPAGHPDRLALELLTTVLGKGRGAYFRIPRGEEPTHPPFSVRVDIVEHPRGDLLVIEAIPSGGIDATEVHLITAVEALAARGIPPAELDRARAHWSRDYYLTMERLDRRARLLAQAEARGSYKDRDRAPAAVAALSASQLRDALRRYLSRDRLTLLEVLTPQSEARTFTAETFSEALQILVAAQRPQEDALLDLLAQEQETALFKPADFRPRFTPGKLRKTAILRGPDIWIQERHLLPVATVGFFFSGGRIQESSSTSGLTGLMLRALLLNLTRREAGLRYHRLERRGAEVEAVVKQDYFGLRIATLSPQLNEVVVRITNWLRDPDTAIEATDLEAARRSILAEARRRDDSAPDALAPVVRSGLYGEHPYGVPRGGRAAALESLQLEPVQSWATRQLVNVHPYLIVLGDFEGTSFLQGLVSQLSDRRYEVRDKVDRPFDFEDDSRGESRSGERLLIGLPGPEALTYSSQVMDVAGWLLGGWSGLMSRQLQRRGLASRFQLFNEAHLNGGALFVGLEGDPTRLDEALQAVKENLGRLNETTLRQDEHFDALVAVMTLRHLRQEDSRLLLSGIIQAVLAGENESYRERTDGAVTSLSRSEVASVLRRYLVLEP